MKRGGCDWTRPRAAIASVLAALMIASPGCSSWQALRVSPETQPATTLPERVNVLLTDGRRVVVYAPRVERDSLLGMCPEGSGFGADEHGETAGRVPCRFAVNDILRIESRQFSAGRTLLLFGGTLVFLGAAALLVFAITYEPG